MNLNRRSDGGENVSKGSQLDESQFDRYTNLPYKRNSTGIKRKHSKSLILAERYHGTGLGFIGNAGLGGIAGEGIGSFEGSLSASPRSSRFRSDSTGTDSPMTSAHSHQGPDSPPEEALEFVIIQPLVLKPGSKRSTLTVSAQARLSYSKSNESLPSPSLQRTNSEGRDDLLDSEEEYLSGTVSTVSRVSRNPSSIRTVSRNDSVRSGTSLKPMLLSLRDIKYRHEDRRPISIAPRLSQSLSASSISLPPSPAPSVSPSPTPSPSSMRFPLPPSTNWSPIPSPIPSEVPTRSSDTSTVRPSAPSPNPTLPIIPTKSSARQSIIRSFPSTPTGSRRNSFISTPTIDLPPMPPLQFNSAPILSKPLPIEIRPGSLAYIHSPTPVSTRLEPSPATTFTSTFENGENKSIYQDALSFQGLNRAVNSREYLKSWIEDGNGNFDGNFNLTNGFNLSNLSLKSEEELLRGGESPGRGVGGSFHTAEMASQLSVDEDILRVYERDQQILQRRNLWEERGSRGVVQAKMEKEESLESSEPEVEGRGKKFWRQRKWWIISFVAVLAIVIAVILGVVLSKVFAPTTDSNACLIINGTNIATELITVGRNATGLFVPRFQAALFTTVISKYFGSDSINCAPQLSLISPLNNLADSPNRLAWCQSAILWISVMTQSSNSQSPLNFVQGLDFSNLTNARANVGNYTLVAQTYRFNFLDMTMGQINAVGN